MESASSDSDGKVKKKVPHNEYNRIICALIEFNIFVFFFLTNLDSSMDILASSTEDLASNDTDPDVTAFDTDLPAAHNVSTV